MSIENWKSNVLGMINNGAEISQVEVAECARCGVAHRLLVSKFRQKPAVFESYTDEIYTHWGICPTIFEPVFLQIKRVKRTRTITEEVEVFENL